MRPGRPEFDQQRDEERQLAEQIRQDMLTLAQQNRRFAGLVESQARSRKEGREKQADLAMALSLRDTAQQLEAQVREGVGSRPLDADDSGDPACGSRA